MDKLLLQQVLGKKKFSDVLKKCKSSEQFDRFCTKQQKTIFGTLLETHFSSDPKILYGGLSTLINKNINIEKLITEDSDVYLALLFSNYISPDSYNSTLIYCISNNFDDTVKQLIRETNIDLNYQNKTGESALMVACKLGHLDTIKLLLENKAKTNLQNDKEETAFSYALEGKSEDTILKIITILFKYNGNLKLTDNHETSNLLKASAFGFTRIVKYILQNTDETMLNYANKYKDTPLSVAKSNGNSDIVDLLIEYGATNLISSKSKMSLSNLLKKK